MKKYMIFGVVMMVLLAGCSSLGASSSGKPLEKLDAPPMIEVFTEEGSISYVVGVNSWNGIQVRRLSTGELFMEWKIPLKAVGKNEVITIKFPKNPPEKIQFQEINLTTGLREKILLDRQGYENLLAMNPPERKSGGYGVQLVSDYQISEIGEGEYQIICKENPERSIRQMSITCHWGENSCEYSFIIEVLPE
jgi:hypothetical protein